MSCGWVAGLVLCSLIPLIWKNRNLLVMALNCDTHLHGKGYYTLIMIITGYPFPELILVNSEKCILMFEGAREITGVP